MNSGYDLSASTYSPDGRIFQACLSSFHDERFDSIGFIGGVCKQGRREFWVCNSKCSSTLYIRLMIYVNFRTAIGLRVKDGVVLALEKLVHSKLLVPGSNRRIQSVDRHIGMVSPSNPYYLYPHLLYMLSC